MMRRNRLGLLMVFLVFFGGSGCERLAFEKARKQGTIEGFESYLARYPEGKNAKWAQANLIKLRFKQAMGERTPEAFRDFLQDFPKSEFAEHARGQLIKTLKLRLQEIPEEDLAKARVVVETSAGQFTLRLRPDKAPGHARNLLLLSAIGFYEGTKVNLIKAGERIHLGDPRGDGIGGPGYVIPAEISDLKHVRGAISMWHLPVDLNTAGSQFIICLTDLPSLDGSFTVFGEVAEGMTVADKIAASPSTGPYSRPPFRPQPEIKINRMRVEGLEILKPPSPRRPASPPK